MRTGDERYGSTVAESATMRRIALSSARRLTPPARRDVARLQRARAQRTASVSGYRRRAASMRVFIGDGCSHPWNVGVVPYPLRLLDSRRRLSSLVEVVRGPHVGPQRLVVDPW